MQTACTPMATIMIVDDTPANLKLLQQLLQAQGSYRTVAFPSGAQALRAAALKPPDLILLDIVMPDMDGFEVCQHLKQDECLRDIPVLFISALNATEDKVHAFNVGGVDYITKPFQAQEIYARVNTHLRLQRLLQASERRQQVLIDELPDVVMRFDTALRHTYVSRNISQLGALPAQAYLGHTHAELGLDAGTCRFWQEAIGAVFREGQSLEAEYPPAGLASPQIHNLRLVPEYNTAGEIESVLALSRDVTLQRQAEQAMIQARKAAEAANQAKTQFLTNMSHEIRTPLNGIIGLLFALQDDRLNTDQTELISLVLSSTHALTDVLNNILDLADLEFNHAHLHPAPFSTMALFTTLIDLFTPCARQKGLALTSDIDPATPDYLISDAPRVRQILFSLLGNAVKFTTSGHVHLSLAPQGPPAADRIWLRFTVEDSGIGIAPEQFETIWQPFSQVDGSSTRCYEGAGLGLALVRRLVDLMQGHISLDSTPGQGTTFTVDLPFVLAYQDSSAATAHEGQLQHQL